MIYIKYIWLFWYLELWKKQYANRNAITVSLIPFSNNFSICGTSKSTSPVDWCFTNFTLQTLKLVLYRSGHPETFLRRWWYWLHSFEYFFRLVRPNVQERFCIDSEWDKVVEFYALKIGSCVLGKNEERERFRMFLWGRECYWQSSRSSCRSIQ